MHRFAAPDFRYPGSAPRRIGGIPGSCSRRERRHPDPMSSHMLLPWKPSSISAMPSYYGSDQGETSPIRPSFKSLFLDRIRIEGKFDNQPRLSCFSATSSASTLSGADRRVPRPPFQAACPSPIAPVEQKNIPLRKREGWKARILSLRFSSSAHFARGSGREARTSMGGIPERLNRFPDQGDRLRHGGSAPESTGDGGRLHDLPVGGPLIHRPLRMINDAVFIVGVNAQGETDQVLHLPGKLPLGKTGFRESVVLRGHLGQFLFKVPDPLLVLSERFMNHRRLHADPPLQNRKCFALHCCPLWRKHSLSDGKEKL